MNFMTLDPGSKSAGICFVKDDKFLKSYTVSTSKIEFSARCYDLYNKTVKIVADLTKTHGLERLDAIFVEILNRQTNYRLLWSIGPFIMACHPLCDKKTKIKDKTAKVDGKSVLTPSHWQKVYKVAKYKSGDKDKNSKILQAYYKKFPKMNVQSADEAVAIFMAHMLLTAHKEGKLK